MFLIWTALYLAVCEVVEHLFVRKQGGEIFRPKLGWSLLYWFGAGVYLSVPAFAVWDWKAGATFLPFWEYVLVALSGLGFFISWPRTIFVDSSGIHSCSALGLRPRAIRWEDVSRISSDWQEEPIHLGMDRIWTFMGTKITVTSGDGGSTASHTVMHRRQNLFLDELRRYLPKEVFDPGLHDWHP